jgi:hypothetical protein
VAASCTPSGSDEPPAKAEDKRPSPSSAPYRNSTAPDVLTVFLTGNELGTLKPCGCSGGQLGGLARRSAVLNTAEPGKRMIVDTGSFVKTDGEQDQIKFQILVDAYGLLGYDLLHLTEQDVEMAKMLGLLEQMGSAFGIISSPRIADVNVPAKFTKKLEHKQTTVAVTVAAFDPAGPVEQVAELFGTKGGAQTVNILILNECNPAIIDTIVATGTVDCLVCPSETDEAGLIGEPDKSPLVVSVGLYGKHVGKLQIRGDEKGDGLDLAFTAVDVTEDLPPADSLVELYKDYQQFVKAAELLERYPRYPLSDGLKYVGSEVCGACHDHDYAYEKWSTKAHADAYATLVKAGTQYDPECVVCHVVGMEYETGFVSEQKTGHLKNVGCENCHGPGSKHIGNPTEEPPGEPTSDCEDCHTPEHSGEFERESYMKKIVHWKELNAGDNVK